MNKDEEVDADDLLSETDRTRHKIRRDFTAAIGYKKIQTSASYFSPKIIVFTHENN